MNREELLEIAKPILFNTEMVRAILDGRKTQTRRIVKNFNRNEIIDVRSVYGYSYKTAPYAPGDVLYVRETWTESHIASPDKFLYRADYDTNIYPYNKWRWHPSINMPKEAARIFLKVTDVRVERLQDITEEQAQKEGANGRFVGDGSTVGSGWDMTPQDEFTLIWDSTIKKADRNNYGWDANPWVWVVEFVKLEV